MTKHTPAWCRRHSKQIDSPVVLCSLHGMSATVSTTLKEEGVNVNAMFTAYQGKAAPCEEWSSSTPRHGSSCTGEQRNSQQTGP